MPIRNIPVGHHEVDYYLECGHMNVEVIEAAIFVPKVGDKRVCKRCKQQTEIKQVMPPYWVDKEDDD